MKLPNGENAVVSLEKLRDYCLDSSHPRGKHKARVFESTCGLTAKDAVVLQSALQRAAIEEEAEMDIGDEYGQRYRIESKVDGSSGSAVIRSLWIVRRDEDFPRLVTRFVL